MRRPSFLDQIIGNPLILTGLFLLEVWLLIEYAGGKQKVLGSAAVFGFLLLWSNAARSRIVAKRREEAEWQAMTGTAPGHSPWGRLAALVRLFITVPPLALILWAGYHFARGFVEPDGVILPSPDEWIFAALNAAIRYTIEGYGWIAANAALLGAAAVVALIAFVLFRSMPSFRTRPRPSKTQVKPGIRQPWEGVVQVVLPVPKK